MATYIKLERSNIVCPNCGDPNHLHHLVGANVGYWDMKCFNCFAYFNFDELYKHRIAEVVKPKTNADRIRAMTDEELAKYLFERGNCSEYCYGICAYQDDEITCKKLFEQDKCTHGVVVWLKQEAT